MTELHGDRGPHHIDPQHVSVNLTDNTTPSKMVADISSTIRGVCNANFTGGHNKVGGGAQTTGDARGQPQTSATTATTAALSSCWRRFGRRSTRTATATQVV